MPTGFNPFAIPNIPNVAVVPLPKVDPNAGLTALLAVQNAIARQQALAARAAGRGGGGNGETNPKYTNYIDLPNGKGGFDTVPVVGADNEGRKARAKQLWNQRINELASQDKDLQESLSKIGKLSVRGQKAELDKIRQQYLPRLFKQWNLPQDMQPDVVRQFTSDAATNIQAQQKAIDNTGVFQSLADNAKLGWYSLRDAFRGIGSTPEEKFIMGEQRAAERQAVIDSNPHLREEELRRREGNDAWTDFFEKPLVNAAEAVGDMVASAGSIMGGQALGAAGAGALLRAIPTPVTQGLATAVQLGGAALGGAAVGSQLGPIELQDRIISEMNAGNLTREQAIAAIQQGELPAQIISGAIAGIPLGVAQTGLPFISRGANTMIGRAAIERNATRAAAEQLTKETGGLISRAGIAPTAEAIGQNALRDAIAQQAEKSFLSRWAGAAGPTALDLGALSALNTMGSNYSYGEATGQPVDITRGAGEAFLSGVAMGSVFGVLNARRPYVPAQRPVPELPNINTDAYRPTIESAQVLPETGGLPGGSTGPTQGAAGPTASGPRPQGPQSGPTGGAQQQYRQQAQPNYQRQQAQQQNTAQQNTAAQYKSYAEWKKYYDYAQANDPFGAGTYDTPQREQFANASDYYRARREWDLDGHEPPGMAENIWRGWAEGTGPEGYYGGEYSAAWNGYGGKRGYSASGTKIVEDIAKKYTGMGRKGALRIKQNIVDALSRNEITPDDIMRVADSYARTNPEMLTYLRLGMDDYLQQWDNARRSAEQKQQQQNTTAGPNPASKGAPNSKEAKQRAADTVGGISPEMQEAQLKSIFYQMLYDDAINPGSMRLTVRNSRLTPQQRIWAEEAIRNFERYAPEIRKQVEDYARGRQESIGAGSASGGSGTAPALGGNERTGQGSPDRTNTVGDSAAAANTQTTVADIANEYLERLTRGNNPLEGRGYAGLSAQNTRTLAEIADFVKSSPLPLREQQQGSNGKSGSGRPAQQPAKPDTGQRSNQPPASPGTGSNGTPEPVSGNQPNSVNNAAEYPSSVLEGSPNLETNSAIALDQTLEVALDEKYNKTQMLQAVKEWANNMVKSGEPVQEVRDAYNLFSYLPQLHKSTAKAVDTIIKKYEKTASKSATNTTQSEPVAPAQPEQSSLFDSVREKAEQQTTDDTTVITEIEQVAPEQSEVATTNPQQQFQDELKAVAKQVIAQNGTTEIEVNRIKNAAITAVKAGVPKSMVELLTDSAFVGNARTRMKRTVNVALRGVKKSQASKQSAKKTTAKTEIAYAQNIGEIRNQLESLKGGQLIEGSKAAFDGYDYWEAIAEGVRIMEEKAAGKTLGPEEEHSYRMMKKYGVQDLNPVITENAKAAAEQGKKLDMKTTEKGQATITRRNARKKVNDPNSETCGI